MHPGAGAGQELTCSMHPEIVRNAPGPARSAGWPSSRGQCLPRRANPELADMTRRFWVSTALTVPGIVLAMGEYLPGHVLASVIAPATLNWIQAGPGQSEAR